MSKKARTAPESTAEQATTDGDETATQQAQVAIEASESEQAPPPFSPERIPGAIEALLLTMDKALPAMKIAEATGMRDHPGVFPKPTQTIDAAVEALNAVYERTGRSFRIESVAGGYRVMTLPEFAPAIAAIQGLRESSKLSRAAIETLAIVAYRQPITRVQIETIRGVACGEVLRGLMEKNLVTIAGRAEELGRPLLYGTTKRFLEAFGLSSMKDLPPVNDVFPGLTASSINEPKPGAKPRVVADQTDQQTDAPDGEHASEAVEPVVAGAKEAQ